MTKIAIAEEIAERIRSSEGPIELVDAQGQTIDHFFSFSQFSGRIGRNRQTTSMSPTDSFPAGGSTTTLTISPSVVAEEPSRDTIPDESLPLHSRH